MPDSAAARLAALHGGNHEQSHGCRVLEPHSESCALLTAVTCRRLSRISQSLHQAVGRSYPAQRLIAAQQRTQLQFASCIRPTSMPRFSRRSRARGSSIITVSLISLKAMSRLDFSSLIMSRTCVQ